MNRFYWVQLSLLMMAPLLVNRMPYYGLLIQRSRVYLLNSRQYWLSFNSRQHPFGLSPPSLLVLLIVELVHKYIHLENSQTRLKCHWQVHQSWDPNDQTKPHFSQNSDLFHVIEHTKKYLDWDSRSKSSSLPLLHSFHSDIIETVLRAPYPFYTWFAVFIYSGFTAKD